MDGLWDCESIDELISHILLARLDEKIKNNLRLVFQVFPGTLIQPPINSQSI